MGEPRIHKRTRDSDDGEFEIHKGSTLELVRKKDYYIVIEKGPKITAGSYERFCYYIEELDGYFLVRDDDENLGIRKTAKTADALVEKLFADLKNRAEEVETGKMK